MTLVGRETTERRAVILAPTGKDAALTRAVLAKAGIESTICARLDEVCRELDLGAAVLLLAEEAAATGRQSCLIDWLAAQPPWSDLPILVVVRVGAESGAVTRAMDLLGNVTVLERPTRVAALVSAARSALRARERQYQARDHLRERERNLRSHALLSAIVASSDDAIISKTLDGQILTWNAGAERLFGYSAAEAVGRPITMLIPEDRASEELAILERLRRGERIEHFETARVAKDGRRLDISLTVSPVRDENDRIIGASKIARDISERRQAERALRESEERFRMLADNMAQLAWICDQLGNATWYNRRWVEYTGLTLEETSGWGWSRVQHPDHLDRVVALIERSAKTGEVWEDTFPILGKDGRYRWFLSRAVPIRDETGTIVRWFGTNTDVTEQRALEDALREADRHKDEFLATLAHELRNPLAPIRNAVQILRMTRQEDPAAERVGEMLERQVNHLVRLVDDLMEISRITRGKIEVRKEPVEIGAVVRGALEASQPLIDAAGHQLAVSLPPDALRVEGDLVRLTQVVANLLSNAAKHCDPGTQVWLTVRREDDEVVVSVRDDGRGIPPDMLTRVFEPFMQVDRHVTRVQGGLGIGLTLVKGLVELHGGSVEAHSDGLGRGSEFVVRLALALDAPPAVTAAPLDGESAALASPRVLVVDDNRDSAESLAALLELLGAEVRVVYSGPDALEALAAHHPVAVLLDIGMPGMDGYEVARRIRQNPEFQTVRLIALTGWGQAEDRHRSESAGFDHHLIKPADLEDLRTLLNSREGAPGAR